MRCAPRHADEDGGNCPMGWVPATITPTVNADVYAANPALAYVLDNLALSVVDVSLATVAADAEGGTEAVYKAKAEEWIAANRDIIDPIIEGAIAAAS